MKNQKNKHCPEPVKGETTPTPSDNQQSPASTELVEVPTVGSSLTGQYYIVPEWTKAIQWILLAKKFKEQYKNRY